MKGLPSIAFSRTKILEKTKQHATHAPERDDILLVVSKTIKHIPNKANIETPLNAYSIFNPSLYSIETIHGYKGYVEAKLSPCAKFVGFCQKHINLPLIRIYLLNLLILANLNTMESK